MEIDGGSAFPFSNSRGAQNESSGTFQQKAVSMKQNGDDTQPKVFHFQQEHGVFR